MDEILLIDAAALRKGLEDARRLHTNVNGLTALSILADIAKASTISIPVVNGSLRRPSSSAADRGNSTKVVPPGFDVDQRIFTAGAKFKDALAVTWTLLIESPANDAEDYLSVIRSDFARRLPLGTRKRHPLGYTLEELFGVDSDFYPVDQGSTTSPYAKSS